MRGDKLAVPLLLMALLFLVPAAAGARAGIGEVVGRVVDQTGASLPGVNVTLHTGCRCQDCTDPTACDCCPDAMVQVTNAEGRFKFLSVNAGTYTLGASLSGFSAVDQEVVVEPGHTTKVDVTLGKPR